MAPSRAYSFPLSHRQSPFTVDSCDVAHLTSCEAFRSIRDLLDCRDDNIFCDSHSEIGPNQKEAWLLQRDITFALVFPIIEVYRNATAAALSMLGDRNIFDLELVFRGEARGAFSWLQCFTTVEQSWCAAEGCPACNVSYVLQSEPAIRLVITACRLASRVLAPWDEQHNLPILDFWTQTLHRALQEDKFWGRDSWKTLGDRAKGLEDGIFAMAQQCCELESLNSNTSDHESTAVTTSAKSHQLTTPRRNLNGDRITKETWMHKIVLGCWTTLQVDAKVQLSRATALRTQPEKAGRGEDGPSRPLSASL